MATFSTCFIPIKKAYLNNVKVRPVVGLWGIDWYNYIINRPSAVAIQYKKSKIIFYRQYVSLSSWFLYYIIILLHSLFNVCSYRDEARDEALACCHCKFIFKVRHKIYSQCVSLVYVLTHPSGIWPCPNKIWQIPPMYMLLLLLLLLMMTSGSGEKQKRM